MIRRDLNRIVGGGAGILGFILAALLPPAAAGPGGSLQRIDEPPAGKLYHGLFYSHVEGDDQPENGVTEADVRRFEKSVGKGVAWVYFSHNWFEGRAFPREKCAWINQIGKVPYIRLMLRSHMDQYRPDPQYALQKILDGKLDADLKAWGRAAREFGQPRLVEWGTECNGDWFPWNGKYHGGSKKTGFGDPAKPDGPERFVAAYRRIVDLARGEGAANITWVWHVNWSNSPAKSWNDLANYYPGDTYVHWVAVSAYGTQGPRETSTGSLKSKLDAAYPRLRHVAPSKPVLLAEFGTDVRNSHVPATEWADAALRDILGAGYDRLIGFCWWNERWQNDDNPAHDSNLMLLDSPPLLQGYRTRLEEAKEKVQEAPILIPGGP